MTTDTIARFECSRHGVDMGDIANQRLHRGDQPYVCGAKTDRSPGFCQSRPVVRTYVAGDVIADRLEAALNEEYVPGETPNLNAWPAWPAWPPSEVRRAFAEWLTARVIV